MTDENRNDRKAGAPASEPKIAPGHIITAIVVVLVPSGLVYLFQRPWLKKFLGMPSDSESSEDPAIRVLDFLESLPTEPALYYAIAAIVGAYLGWRFLSHSKLHKEFERASKENEDESSLTLRDWWVVQGLRKRAIALRVQADWILGGIFLLLFIGIYFVLFVVPNINEKDIRILAQIEQRRYKTELDGIFNLLAEGRYWLEIPDDISEYDGYKLAELDMTDDKIDVETFQTISILKRGHGERNADQEVSLESRERGTTVEFSADGKTGVVSGSRGSVFLTRDGGENWGSPGFSLKGREWITAAAFSADGKTGVVAGDEGSVFLTRDGGENWGSPGFSLKGREWITAAAFSADGKTGVVAGDEGSVFLTRDGGENWGSPDLSLNSEEGIAAAAFSADGEAGVVAGNEGSVFLTRDGGENWMSTKGEKLGSFDSFPSMMWITNESLVAKMWSGSLYISKPYPGLTKMSLVDIHKEMEKDRVLSNSEVYKDIRCVSV